MAAYLMAVVSLVPNTAARCRGSAPQVRASSSCRSTRSRSRVAVRPRHDCGQPVLADGPGGHGGLLVDDQVRVGGAGPAAAAVGQPGQEQVPGQVVERAGRARDDQPPAAQVGVAEVKLPDGPGPGGVDGGQGDREAGGGGDGGGCGLVDVCGLQRLDEDQGTLAVADAAGGVAEDRAGLLGVAEQRPQGGERLAAQAAVQRLGGRDDVGGRDLAQVDVLAGPGQQQRVDPVEVHPDGVLVAGTAAGPALAAGAQPVPDAGGHRRGQQREPCLRQGGEGRDPVIVQQAREAEDLGGAGDAEVPAAQGRRELGPGDHVSGLVAGEHDGQRAAGLGDDLVVPAAGTGQVPGDAPGLLQGRAGDRRGGPVALVEVQRFAGCAQLQLDPARRGGRRGGTLRQGLPGRAGAAQAAHARQGQLPVPGSGEISRGEPPAAPGCDAGLQPAQPAVAFLDRDDPPAPGALAAVIAAGEVIAGPAVGL